MRTDSAPPAEYTPAAAAAAGCPSEDASLASLLGGGEGKFEKEGVWRAPRGFVHLRQVCRWGIDADKNLLFQEEGNPLQLGSGDIHARCSLKSPLCSPARGWFTLMLLESTLKPICSAVDGLGFWVYDIGITV